MNTANNILLTRDDFRNLVFKRDGNLCVICKSPAQDAHHILERRLFNDGGYYLDNGASLCGSCHIKAEETTLSCDEIRKAIGIEKVVLPEHLYDEYEYDKWGNIINPSGTRTIGELFYDESVQKILKQGNVLHLFDFKIKHPRTHHLPWSESVSDDDKVISSLEQFDGKEIVITSKLDGEQTNCYSNGYVHARSLDSGGDYTRSWVINFWNKVFYNLPEGFRVCAENLAYKHSIKYDNLDTFFYVHSIWNEKNICLSWDETVEYCQLLDLQHVPVLYRGLYNDFNPDGFFKPVIDGQEQEGYVLRIADEFGYSQFKKYVGKFVKKNFLSGVTHWRHGQQLQPNTLKS